MMRTLRRWLVRLGGLFGRREAEISEEIRSHIEMHVADNLRAGMTPAKARREALLRLGGVEALKEAQRERSSVPFIEHLVLDLRFALRQLRKSPVFAGTAMVVLALGICASIAIFAFVDAALIKPLPYPDPANLMLVSETNQMFTLANLSYLDYADWSRYNKAFTSLDVFTGGGFLISTATGAEPAPAGRVSGNFFATLGVKPLLGRGFVPGEETQAGSRKLVLSYAGWQKRFGGGYDVLGKTLAMSGQEYTVVGVLPADFQFGPLGSPEFWTLVDIKDSCAIRRSCHNLNGVGRLKPGVTIAAAMANLSSIARELEKQYPDSNRDRGATVQPLADVISGRIRPVLMLVMTGAGLLLLIASVNVASLVLARSEGRKREMAVRRALGASFGRLGIQFLSESAVLVLGATSVGLLAANTAIRALKALIPADMLPGMPFLADLGISGRVLTAAGVIAVAAIILFSVAPLLHLALFQTREGLAEGSRGSSANAWRRLGSRLVVVELAVAMVLLVGAGLFGKSLYRLLHVPLGFQPDHLAMLDIGAPGVRYASDAQRAALGLEIVRKAESLPGVESAALTTQAPVTFNGNTDWVRIVGKPYDGKHIEVNERDVSSGFFLTVGAKLIRGRLFDEADDASKRRVVIINQAFAKKYFAGEDPVGQQIGDTALSAKSICTIVGVIDDIRDGALDEQIWPSEYHPFSQDPSPSFTLIARTHQRPEAVLSGLAAGVRQLHPDIGARDETTMDTLINNSSSAYLHRSSAWLVAAFALTALLLGIVGLYGVIAYSVSQRTREIGLRIALGARHSSVYGMVLREAGWLAAAGIGFGTLGAVGAAMLARKLLFGVSSWDVETLVSVAAVLGFAAMFASFVPARRAASVNPVEALRTE